MTTLVIFGASGDLAARKLLPALYRLHAAKLLPDDFTIVGAARREITPESLILSMRHYLDSFDDTVIAQLQAMIRVIRMDSGNRDDYDHLRAMLADIESGTPKRTRLFYLSVPPTAALPVVDALASSGVASAETAQILLEKPFGYDLASAQELERHLLHSFGEERMYRIDHYLAKEVVQPLKASGAGYVQLRQNWDNTHIERIEIEIREALEVGDRANFYEQTGALRDVIQNHVLELAALTLMEDPGDDTTTALHTARAHALQAIAPVGESNAIRGQYRGYTAQVGNPDSHTETFAALRLQVKTNRWDGVPVVVLAGKGLHTRRGEIRLYPRDNHPIIFSLDGLPQSALDGYGRVLHDALKGDRRNFVCGEEVIASWRIMQPVLDAWQRSADGLVHYDVGTDGPRLPW